VLRDAVARLLALARSIPDEAPASELLEAFWDAVSKLGVYDALRRMPSALFGTGGGGEGPSHVLRGAAGLLGRELDRAVARDQAAGEALGRLVSDLRVAFRESGFGRRPLRRRDFARWVRLAAAEVNLVAREVAGRRFQHVFLGGLVDGRFPGRPQPQPLLSEAERGVLNQLAGAPLFRLGVADGEQHLPVRLAEDRLLFHLVLASAEKSVTLSRSRFDDAGRELLGSAFLDGVRQAVDGLDERVLPRMPLPSLDDVATEAELRARAALEVLGPPGTRQTVADARREALAEALSGEAWLDEVKRLAAAESERLGFFSDEARAAGAFSGQVTTPDAVQARLDFHAGRPVSAAELNVWGQCAFRGLGLYVLGLEGAEAAGEEPDARVNGTFLHDALERLVPALERAGLWGRPDVDAATLAPHVETAVREAAAATQARLPTGHPELWALHQARTVRQLMRLVLERGVWQPFGPSKVEAVELRFGEREGSAPGLEQVVVPKALDGERDVYVRGRIDRVDVMPGQVGVLDYKTSPKERGEVAEALLTEDFQLPLYLWAIRQYRPGLAVTGAWVGIKRPKSLRLEDVLAAKNEGDVAGLLAADAPTRRKMAEEGKPNLPNAVHGLLAKLRAGDFGARATSCRSCELKAVCRISARKLPEEGPAR
jgi:RecB family exonuclease